MCVCVCWGVQEEGGVRCKWAPGMATRRTSESGPIRIASGSRRHYRVLPPMACIPPMFRECRDERLQAYLHEWLEADRRREYAEALAANARSRSE